MPSIAKLAGSFALIVNGEGKSEIRKSRVDTGQTSYTETS